MIRTLAATLATSTCIVALATPASAQTREFNVPAGSLRTALATFARQSGRQVIYRGDELKSASSPGVQGARTAEDALDAILAGTGFVAKEDRSGAFGVVKMGNKAVGYNASSPVKQNNDGSDAEDSRSADIVVTGSRIRGAPSASPVISLGRQQIIDAGQTTIADALRSLPENFSGGQNPGVLLGAQSANPANANETGGSGINLRGLGPDATLTLLNGHRVAYDGSSQAVDVSTIPLAALDRVEIVADGASALYGSDAVAGVANIILRRDYDGISVMALGGAATDGGDWQQQYSAVAGKRWSSGGFIATYNYARNTAIQGTQRDYTGYLTKPDTLLPAAHSHSAILSGHQDIGSALIFSIDGIFNKRWNLLDLGLPGYYSETRSQTTTYSVTPSLTAHLGSWTLGVTGSYGRDISKSTASGIDTASGALLFSDKQCVCNTLKSVEATAEGPLIKMPAGNVRLAIGGGVRENSLREVVYDDDYDQYAKRTIGYGYGELFVPVVGPDMGIPLVRSLAVTGALRYEHYNDFGGITTPKFGLLFTPVAGLDLKASWGRSFKAPLLSEENIPAGAYLYPIRSVGGDAYPETDTALLAYGSPGHLKPERATSWTTTAEFRPEAAPRTHFLASYFHVDYRDRIVQPINITAALSSPLYAAFVTYQPSVAAQQAVIDRSATGLNNFTAGDYDPANVVAILNDYYVNVAAQTIRGVDLQADDHFDFGGGDLALTAQASWLTSRQRNSSLSAATPLAGTVFNPPHFRARAGMIWTGGSVTASSFLNYIGPVTDIRDDPAVSGSSMATIDLALRWHGSLGPMRKHGLDIALAVQNLADERPPYLRHTADYYPPFDSTNYSAIGRTVVLSVTTRW